jgi:hypothetical protein
VKINKQTSVTESLLPDEGDGVLGGIVTGGVVVPSRDGIGVSEVIGALVAGTIVGAGVPSGVEVGGRVMGAPGVVGGEVTEPQHWSAKSAWYSWQSAPSMLASNSIIPHESISEVFGSTAMMPGSGNRPPQMRHAEASEIGLEHPQ